MTPVQRPGRSATQKLKVVSKLYKRYRVDGAAANPGRLSRDTSALIRLLFVAAFCTKIEDHVPHCIGPKNRLSRCWTTLSRSLCHARNVEVSIFSSCGSSPIYTGDERADWPPNLVNLHAHCVPTGPPSPASAHGVAATVRVYIFFVLCLCWMFFVLLSQLDSEFW